MDMLQGNSSVLEPKTVVEKILTTQHRLFAECPKHSANGTPHNDSCDGDAGFAECLFRALGKALRCAKTPSAK